MKKQIRYVLLAIGILAIIGIGIGVYLYNKPHKDYTKMEPDVFIDATELYNAFEENEQMANEKYLNKVIQVTGNVASVTENRSGDISIALEDEFFGVTCTIDSITVQKYITAIEGIETGEQITLKGRCDGMLTDVRISKATLIEN